MADALDHALFARDVEAIVLTNAVHLYHDLVETLASRRRMLMPEGRAFIQSGNIGGDMPGGPLIIDQTVEWIHNAAV